MEVMRLIVVQLGCDAFVPNPHSGVREVFLLVEVVLEVKREARVDLKVRVQVMSESDSHEASPRLQDGLQMPRR